METLASWVPLLADIIIAGAFLCCIFLRGERGLCRSLIPAAATLLALVGAALLTAALRESVTEAVFPRVRDFFRSRVDLSTIRSLDPGDISSQLERLLPDTVTRLAGRLGLETGTFVSEAMHAAPRATAQRIAEEAFTALLRPVTAAVVRVALLFLLFVILRLLLGAVAAAAGLAVRLPVVRWIDFLGGAALGFLECAVVFWLLCRLLSVFEWEPLTEILAQSRLLGPFIAA